MLRQDLLQPVADFEFLRPKAHVIFVQLPLHEKNIVHVAQIARARSRKFQKQQVLGADKPS